MKSLTIYKSLILLGVSTLVVTAATKFPISPKADLILGENDYYPYLSNAITARSLRSASSLVVSPASGKVFVADTDRNRVLRYKSIEDLVNFAEAEEVFGQVRFDQATPSSGLLGLNQPSGIFLDRFGSLWVADRGNNRVVMYQDANSKSYPVSADKTFGKTNFGTLDLNHRARPSSFSMVGPTSVWVDSSDRLWVGDSGNSRILRFDNISKKESGAEASGVLGQVDFTSNSSSPIYFYNKLIVGSIAISTTGSLFVSQPLYNRVIRFDNAASLPNGTIPSSVLGRSDFSTDGAQISTTSLLADVSGITITPDDNLWVLHNRGDKATLFASASTKKDGGIPDGFVTFATTNLDGPTVGSSPGIYIDYQSKLWVSSYHKLRRYSADETKPLLSITTVIDEKTKLKSLVVKGEASDEYGISKVQYTINNSKPKSATGTTNWKFQPRFRVGKNRLRIFATDSVGNVSLTRTFKIVVKK